MSDAGTDNSATTNGNGNAATVQFTERELQMLAWAMQCLKSGPPDVSYLLVACVHRLLAHALQIDYEKLARFAGMSNPRSASNAWGKIRNKLIANNPDGAEAMAPKTPKGGRKKPAANADGETATPKTKTPGKRALKKDTVGDKEPPKKKARTTKAKKASDDYETSKCFLLTIL